MKINILDISVIVLKLMMLISLIYMLLASFKLMFPSDYSKISSKINDEYKTFLQGKAKASIENKASVWNTAVSKLVRVRSKK